MMQHLSKIGIGASEIAAACGISRYRSRFGLWLEKTGRAPAFSGNVHTRLGQLCEPRARQLYANLTGHDVSIPPCSIFHPDHAWARCTPDGEVMPLPSRHGLEIKCVGYFVGRRFKYEIPIEYEAQCQWGAFVAGWDRIDLAALVGADDLAWERFILGDVTDPSIVFGSASLEVYTLSRSESAISALFNGAQEFLELVHSDTQPPVDDSHECGTWLKSRIAPSKIEIDGGEIGLIVDEFRAAWLGGRAAIKALALAKNRVLEAMANAGANRITTSDGPIDLRIDRNKKASLLAPRSWGNPEEH